MTGYARIRLAGLRVQATHNAFNEHARACEKALAGRWTLCPELVALDRDCEAAAYQYGKAIDASRLAAVGAA